MGSPVALTAPSACSRRCSSVQSSAATPITGQSSRPRSSSRYSERSVILRARSPVMPKTTRASPGRVVAALIDATLVGFPGPGAGPLARRQTALAQGEAQLDLLPGRALALGPLGLDDEWELLEARLGQVRGAPALAQLARADVRVTVPVGPQRRLRVVEVQRAQSLDPHHPVKLVHRLC